MTAFYVNMTRSGQPMQVETAMESEPAQVTLAELLANAAATAQLNHAELVSVEIVPAQVNG